MSWGPRWELDRDGRYLRVEELDRAGQALVLELRDDNTKPYPTSVSIELTSDERIKLAAHLMSSYLFREEGGDTGGCGRCGSYEPLTPSERHRDYLCATCLARADAALAGDSP